MLKRTKNSKSSKSSKKTVALQELLMQKRKVSLTGRFWIYIAVFVFAIIFTQALQSKISNLFFWFVLLLPGAMLLYALSAANALRAYMLSESAVAEKLENVIYEFRIINEYILPYPFIEAIVTLPQTDSVRCSDRIMKISMSPLEAYTVRNNISFRFRGTYEIGVKCFFAYDFFRLFRVRINMDCKSEVSVMPRKLLLDDSDVNAISDSAEKTQKSPYTFDKLEVSDIRDYRPGDGLKSIHWKLSSKSEDFVVRDYNTGVSKLTYVFCDMSVKFPNEMSEEDALYCENKLEEEANSQSNDKASENSNTADGANRRRRRKKSRNYIDVADISDSELEEYQNRKKAILDNNDSRHETKEKPLFGVRTESADVTELADSHAAQILESPKYYEDMNEYCADGAVELATAAVLRELRLGNECCLVWFDSRAVAGAFAYYLTCMEDFDSIFKLFATAPLCSEENCVTRLFSMVADNQSVKQIIVSSAINPILLRDFCGVAGMSSTVSYGMSEVMLYEPDNRFAFPKERRLFLENCRSELSKSGMKLAIVRTDDKASIKTNAKKAR